MASVEGTRRIFDREAKCSIAFETIGIHSVIVLTATV